MNRMEFDELYASLPADGWLSYPEARALFDAASLAPGPILEVGCYQGRASCLLASLRRPLYCVDPFDGFAGGMSGDEVERRWRENLKSRGLSAELFRQRAEDWEPRPVGFAYLDGDHSYEGTASQIRLATACGAAAVAVHDVNDTGGGVEVRDACLALLGRWHSRVERLAVWELIR